MKKTNRTNKTNLIVKWPAGFYTIETLMEHNSDFIPITLRVRLNNAIKDKSVTVLGSLKGGKGRPKLAFANAPVSNETIEAAKAAGVVMENVHADVINVVSVNSTKTIEVDHAEEKSVTIEVEHNKTAVV